MTRVEALVTPYLQEKQTELVDLTYEKSHGGWTLCFYLDRSGGITLDDCEMWSRLLGDVLEKNDVFNHPYSLEVSSPGIYRPLKKIKDFQNYIGERIDVKLYAPHNGQKNYHGILLGADENEVRIREEGHGDASVPFQQIAKANLNPDIKF